MYSHSLLQKYPIISDQVDKRELTIILQQLETVLSAHRSGSIVEFGCYIGTTSLFIRRLLDAHGAECQFHVYDSFAGLPEKRSQDMSPAGTQFVAGALSVSKKDFMMQFKKAGLSLPVIHKGWFSDLSPRDIPDTIEFAFLDGDYYESIATSLHLITPRLMTGAIIVVDDYANEALPGSARAVDEWRRKHASRLDVVASLAVIKLV